MSFKNSLKYGTGNQTHSEKAEKTNSPSSSPRHIVVKTIVLFRRNRIELIDLNEGQLVQHRLLAGKPKLLRFLDQAIDDQGFSVSFAGPLCHFKEIQRLDNSTNIHIAFNKRTMLGFLLHLCCVPVFQNSLHPLDEIFWRLPRWQGAHTFWVSSPVLAKHCQEGCTGFYLQNYYRLAAPSGSCDGLIWVVGTLQWLA